MVLERERDINLYQITDLFCDEQICRVGDVDKSYYYDNGHLSTFGALKLSGVINNIFSKQERENF